MPLEVYMYFYVAAIVCLFHFAVVLKKQSTLDALYKSVAVGLLWGLIVTVGLTKHCWRVVAETFKLGGE